MLKPHNTINQINDVLNTIPSVDFARILNVIWAVIRILMLWKMFVNKEKITLRRKMLYILVLVNFNLPLCNYKGTQKLYKSCTIKINKKDHFRVLKQFIKLGSINDIFQDIK